jgi:hypothetical protein
MEDRTAPATPLRVGLMLDALSAPAWIAKILRQIEASDFATITFALVNDEPPPPQPRLARLRAPRRRHLLFHLYDRVDRRVFARPPDAFAREDLEPLLAGATVRHATPLRPKPFEHRFTPADVRAVREQELDVILRFGFNIIRGEILDCARYGVWSYHHGDNREYRGSPDLFWEIYERNPVSGTLLQVLTDDLDAGHVLYRSFHATQLSSLWRNRNAAYWKSAEFVTRRLRDAAEGRWPQIQASADFREPTPYAKAIYRRPDNRQMVRFLARLAAGFAARQLRKLVVTDEWDVRYRRASGDPGLPPGTDGFRPLPQPRGRELADPFLVEEGGRALLFVEDYAPAGGRGTIACVELHADGRPGSLEPVLEQPHHLSYPFVFRRGDEWYLVPESHEARRVELFRADEFPHRWSRAAVMLDDVRAVDATVCEHEGRWWMWVNIAVDGADVADELHLFHAAEPAGPWTPHPLNPVVSDVRLARPAGRPFVHGDRLIRPAQDCSVRYGYATVFCEVLTLSPEAYAERPVARLEPGWLPGQIGGHTYNAGAGWEVVDCARAVPRVPLPRRVLDRLAYAGLAR